MNTQTTNASPLAEMVRKRLSQLGISRRQFCINYNISRQTLYEILHRGKTNLMPNTLAALDLGCHWPPGTAARYASGDLSLGDGREDIDRIQEYLTRIIQRIALMTIDELEREAIWLEEELFGRNSHDMADSINMIRKALQTLVPNLYPEQKVESVDVKGKRTSGTRPPVGK